MNNLLTNANVKKALIIIGPISLILIIVLIILISTGNTPQTTSPDETVTPSGTPSNVTLEYWGLWEPEEVMKPLIEKYQNLNPHVKIKYDQRKLRVPEYEKQLFERLELAVTEGQPAPDIIKINNTWLPKYEKYMAPLPSNIMSSEEYGSTFFDVCKEDFTGSDGQIYSIPIGIDSLALFYNKPLLAKSGYDEPPADWDSLLLFAEETAEIYKEDGIYIIPMGATENVSHSADIISLLLLQNQADLISKGQDSKLSINLNSTNATTALRYYKDFQDIEEVWSPDLRIDLDMFFRQELVMFFAPSWRTFDIIEAAPHIDFGVAPVPQLEANDPINYAMYWGEGVSKTSQNSEEAWKFLKFLSEEENIKQFYAESSKIRPFGQPYPLKSLQKDLVGERYVGPIMEMAPYLKSWKMGQYPEIEKHINNAILDSTEAQNSINQILSGL